jgi:hypothetical protein
MSPLHILGTVLMVWPIAVLVGMVVFAIVAGLVQGLREDPAGTVVLVGFGSFMLGCFILIWANGGPR